MRLTIFLLILTSLVVYAGFRVHVARSQDRQALKSMIAKETQIQL